MSNEIENLQARVKALEELIHSMVGLNTQDFVNEKMDDAKVMAIYSMVQDLAEKAGVPTDEFLKHYEIRFRWWHDYYLRKAESISPAFAAEIDPRTIEEAGVSESYPSIFEPPLEDNS